MNYRKTVEQIQSLHWEKLDTPQLKSLMVLSGYAAKEFGQSLRIALKLYPQDAALQEMAREELKTDNLRLGDYNRKGDHAEFIWHFIDKYDLTNKVPPTIVTAGEAYLQAVDSLDSNVRAMSIFSREKELPGIFAKIVDAPTWRAPTAATTAGLPEFSYYLKRHIELDSGDGGHADKVKHHTINDSVDKFYQQRLNLYRCIDTLFAGE